MTHPLPGGDTPVDLDTALNTLGALAESDASLEALEVVSDQLQRLREGQESLIKSEICHLRELAMLNRAGDALSISRSYDQVVTEIVAEVWRIVKPTGIWFFDTDAAGNTRAVLGPNAQPNDANLVSRLAQRLAQTMVRNITRNQAIPAQVERAIPNGVLVGLPVVSSKHLIGVLVLLSENWASATDTARARLLQTLLRQAGVGCENALLFSTTSRMITATVLSLALAVEARDSYTGGHVMRVTAYAVRLGEEIGASPEELDTLQLGGFLHDIGKVAIPDAILNKPGKLDKDEYTIMQTHAAAGDEILGPIPQLKSIRPIIRHHHERMDGKGYPDGLRGSEIPQLARIAAIADAFDAMTSDRPYRKGMDHQKALAEIQRCAGQQFDPELVDAFCRISQHDLNDSALSMERWRLTDQRDTICGLLGFLEMDRPRLQGEKRT